MSPLIKTPVDSVTYTVVITLTSSTHPPLGSKLSTWKSLRKATADAQAGIWDEHPAPPGDDSAANTGSNSLYLALLLCEAPC